MEGEPEKLGIRRTLFGLSLPAGSRALTGQQQATDNSTPQPVQRTSLDIDTRVFPQGIKPGDLIEIKGPHGCGKTFTLTYILCRFLVCQTTKAVILINTCHHFSLTTFISILSQIDDDISNATNIRITPSPKFRAYLRRIFILECFTADDLLNLFKPISGTNQKSYIENMLLMNSEIGLIAIDNIDGLSILSSNSGEVNLLELIWLAVKSTSTPVITTRMGNIQNFSKRSYRTDSDTDSDEEKRPIISHLLVTENVCRFSQTLTIVPVQQETLSEIDLLGYPNFYRKMLREREVGIQNLAQRLECIVHLRAWRSISGIGIRHRFRFSIFAGMLWFVVDDGCNI